AERGGAGRGGAERGGAERGGAEPRGAERWSAERGSAAAGSARAERLRRTRRQSAAGRATASRTSVGAPATCREPEADQHCHHPRRGHAVSLTLVLVGIVVFAFAAGHWLTRSLSRFITLSGAEYMLVGILIGPHMPWALLGPRALAQLEPVM